MIDLKYVMNWLICLIKIKKISKIGVDFISVLFNGIKVILKLIIKLDIKY